MKTFFSRYLGFLASLFLTWLCLAIGKIFGFSFGLDILVFFKVFLILFTVLIILETKKRWRQIWLSIKSLYFKTKTSIYSSLRKYPTVLEKIAHFFPLVFYSLWQASKKYFSGIILVLCVFSIIVDIFIFDFTSDLLILLLTGLWIWLVRVCKFQGKVSIAGGLILIALCPFLLIFGKEAIAEKAAIRAYIFLIIGAGTYVFD